MAAFEKYKTCGRCRHEFSESRVRICPKSGLNMCFYCCGKCEFKDDKGIGRGCNYGK